MRKHLRLIAGGKMSVQKQEVHGPDIKAIESILMDDLSKLSIQQRINCILNLISGKASPCATSLNSSQVER